MASEKYSDVEKFNLIRGCVMAAGLQSGDKTELLDFLRQLEHSHDQLKRINERGGQ